MPEKPCSHFLEKHKHAHLAASDPSSFNHIITSRPTVYILSYILQCESLLLFWAGIDVRMPLGFAGSVLASLFCSELIHSDFQAWKWKVLVIPMSFWLCYRGLCSLKTKFMHSLCFKFYFIWIFGQLDSFKIKTAVEYLILERQYTVFN